jgi:hypothetical protein
MTSRAGDDCELEAEDRPRGEFGSAGLNAELYEPALVQAYNEYYFEPWEQILRQMIDWAHGQTEKPFKGEKRE